MTSSPSRLAIASAFLAVYIIWGSTYFAIAVGVREMPPFLMAGARWIIAGVALYLWRRTGGFGFVLGRQGLRWRRAKGDARPTLVHWRSASIVGAFLIVGGNGTVSWAEQLVPSGLTALLIAIVPVWIALLLWATTGARPTARIALGILAGLIGVVLLVGPTLSGEPGILIGAILILGASLSWATGSIYARRAKLPTSVLLGAAMEMIVGGVILTVLGLATGEAARVDLAGIDLAGWSALAFLIVFGSIVAYSAYVWLLQVVRAEVVATYAFVNPVVAVFLGAAFNHESFSTGTMVAAGLIVLAVAIVVTAPKPPPTAKGPSAAD